MLRKFAKLAGGMLVLHGHVADIETALDRPGSHRPPRTPRPGRGIRVLQSRDWRGALELLALAAIWGGSYLFMRISAASFGPLPLVDLRLFLGAMVLAPFLWRERAHFAAARWGKIAAIAAINSAIPFLLFAWGAERAPAGVGAIVNSMAVPFAALAAFALLGERIGGRRALALLAGLVGVAVLAGGHIAGASLGAAVAAGTLASLCYGVSANLIKRYLSDLPPIALAGATLTCGAVALAPFALASWPSAPLPAHVWLSGVLLGVLCTGIAYALYFRLIQRLGATRAAMVIYLVPIFGMAWAWLFLGEPLTANMALGGALILGGLVFGQREARVKASHRIPARMTHPRPCVGCG